MKILDINAILNRKRLPNIILDFEQRKMLATASLLSVFAFAFLINGLVDIKTFKIENSATRSIASIDVEQLDDSMAIIEKIEGSIKRDIAKSARSPSHADKLQFDVLQTNYSFKFDKSGKINEITYVPNGDTDNPTFLDSEKILRSYKSVFSLEYTAYELKQSLEDENEKVDTFELFDNEISVGNVNYRTDKKGRFISIQFAKN